MTLSYLAYIALGSNLDNPQAQVKTALTELNQLSKTRLVNQSSLYSSQAVGGPANQPDFINAVASIETQLSPLELLDALQALEQKHQRKRLEHWGPRTLDLDILLYADEIIQNARLTVPHAYMTERAFVLWPLAEIAPNLLLPSEQSLSELLIAQPMGSMQRLKV